MFVMKLLFFVVVCGLLLLVFIGSLSKCENCGPLWQRTPDPRESRKGGEMEQVQRKTETTNEKVESFIKPIPEEDRLLQTMKEMELEINVRELKLKLMELTVREELLKQRKMSLEKERIALNKDSDVMHRPHEINSNNFFYIVRMIIQLFGNSIYNMVYSTFNYICSSILIGDCYSLYKYIKGS